MFKECFAETKQKRTERKQKLADLEKKILEESLPAVNRTLFDGVNSSSAEIIATQTQIEEKAKKIRQDWSSYQKEAERWVTLIADLDTVLTEIGDVQQWAQSVQTDVETVFREVHEKRE